MIQAGRRTDTPADRSRKEPLCDTRGLPVAWDGPRKLHMAEEAPTPIAAPARNARGRCGGSKVPW